MSNYSEIQSGHHYEILTNVIGTLLEFQTTAPILPQNFQQMVDSFNIYLLHQTPIFPSAHTREFFHQLKKIPLYEMGFTHFDPFFTFFTPDNQIDPALIDWYNNRLLNDSPDQSLVRDFLFSCRRAYQQTGDPLIIDMYKDIRAFINPSHYCITFEELKPLKIKYGYLIPSIGFIEKWYEAMPFSSDQKRQCPVCGKLLADDAYDLCTEMCQYYQSKKGLAIKTFKIKEKRKYFILKRGIYTYTLLPGLSEQRIFDVLKKTYPTLSISLYPEIDRFDLALESKEGQVYVDVKDIKSPYDLVDFLNKNKTFSKMIEEARDKSIYLVIPDHRKALFEKGRYKKIVKKEIEKRPNGKTFLKHVSLVYENEFYQKVGQLL